MIRDESEEIERIEWNVYGKIQAVVRENGSEKPDLYFSYDAEGNRIAKKAVDNSGTVTTTYYIREGSGNTMTVYKKLANVSLSLEEQHIYGSSRIGMIKPDGSSLISLGSGISQNNHKIGLRNYELSDHIENVHVILTDLKKIIGANLEANVTAACIQPGWFYPGESKKESGSCDLPGSRRRCLRQCHALQLRHSR